MIRPATKEDIERFYPDQTMSFRAWVGEVDGEPRGIAGIAYTRPYPSLFSKFDEPYRDYLRRFAVWKLIHRIGKLVHASPVPVVAFSEPEEATSPRLLQSLGFTRIEECEGGIDLYEWRKQ